MFLNFALRNQFDLAMYMLSFRPFNAAELMTEIISFSTMCYSSRMPEPQLERMKFFSCRRYFFTASA